ncbi:PhzF family phenazine biosynthesis protein [Mammaliicoccus sciuri]|uniref:PhzF family phenazine biosynthesis protein n=1 Tax=Mammaliicoccus sciuri TaxID=1296 RepID=UPI00265B923C|nr:PhzF family phenazine biosynthesis protein [Mammaliicoccus sciuri]MDO0955787.1 PhzF family phenazine biosynthesis protein [Mammaliicoccus sciuri]
MKQLSFKQVDVFPNEPFKGNPVAVIFDAYDLTVEQMKDYIYEGTTGVTIFGENEDVKDTTFEVRSFAPNEGVNEDPVCGSGNGCVAALNEIYGLVENKEYSNSQGECINRNGRVYIKREDGLKLGGISKIVIDGKIRIEN